MSKSIKELLEETPQNLYESIDYVQEATNIINSDNISKGDKDKLEVKLITIREFIRNCF